MANGHVVDARHQARSGAHGRGTRTTRPHSRDAWARVWFELARGSWSTVAVVPATTGADAAEAASALAGIATDLGYDSPTLLDGRGVTGSAATPLLAAMGDLAATGRKALVITDAPSANPIAIGLARATDAAVLLVVLGATSFGAARDTVDVVGRERFLGSIAVGGRR